MFVEFVWFLSSVGFVFPEYVWIDSEFLSSMEFVGSGESRL